MAAVLTPEARVFFEEQGYMVVPDVVPPALCEAVVAAVFAFLGQDPDDPATWYPDPPRPRGMANLFHHQALWDVRQHPRVHQVFSEILGTERLWVSFDRASMKPPEHPAHPGYAGRSFLHWDADLEAPSEQLEVQGVVALRDTAANQGGFQCAPGSHKFFLREAARMTPAERRRRCPDLPGLAPHPVAAAAGSLIIWNERLLHGNGVNRSQQPRLAQYVTMSRATAAGEGAGQRGRAYHSSAGDPERRRELEAVNIHLTPLGRRLAGFDPWPASTE